MSKKNKSTSTKPTAIAARSTAELIAQAVEVSPPDSQTRQMFALLGTIASVDRRGYRKLRSYAWSLLAESEGKGRSGTQLRREWLASKAGAK